MDIRNVVSLSGGLLLLGAAGYFWGGFGQMSLRPTVPVVTGLPDYEVTGITGLRTDARGLVSEKLTAQSLKHFPETDHGEVLAPVLSMHQDGLPRWELTADRALTRQDNQELELRGKVHGRSLAGNIPISLETEFLVANRTSQVMSSTAPIVVRNGANMLSSVGFRADIQSGVLVLPAQVRGNYVLPSR